VFPASVADSQKVYTQMKLPDPFLFEVLPCDWLTIWTQFNISMEQASWETDGRLPSKKFPAFFIAMFLSWTSWIQFTHFFLSIHFNVIHPSIYFCTSQVVPSFQHSVHISHLFCARCTMRCGFHRLDNILWRAYTMKHFIMKFSSSSLCFLPPRSKYSHSHNTGS
jgi:hypothetical protein